MVISAYILISLKFIVFKSVTMIANYL